MARPAASAPQPVPSDDLATYVTQMVEWLKQEHERLRRAWPRPKTTVRISMRIDVQEVANAIEAAEEVAEVCRRHGTSVRSLDKTIKAARNAVWAALRSLEAADS